jgi:MFS family permease
VVGAGSTSALGDFCYETTTVILLGFLAVLGLPPAVLGMIEGTANAVASFTKMISGLIADKLGHRKLLVVVGYGLTPIGQMLIALAAGWPLILWGRIISWFGKGLRGPLRDAIVMQAVQPKTRGRAFGFHRASDTIGAVLGPLLGVAMLGWVQGWNGHDGSFAFRVVLRLSLVPGVLAVVAFFTLVQDPEHSPNPALRFFHTLRGMPIQFKRHLAAVGLFGIGDYSHNLLILAATQRLTGSMGWSKRPWQLVCFMFGAMWSKVADSFPIGVLADRFGHMPMLIAGYVLDVLTAVLTAGAFAFHIDSIVFLGVIFLVAGLYMAVQEALESTGIAEMVSHDLLATAVGALGTVNGTAKFISSTVVGVLWTAISPVFSFGLAARLMFAGTIVLRQASGSKQS